MVAERLRGDFEQRVWAFGTAMAFLVLTLLVFDPNLLDHGALVTTDTGLACFLFASVYAFYRYVKAPSPLRLLVAGLATGLSFSATHTGVLAAPILVVLALSEVWRNRGAELELQPQASLSHVRRPVHDRRHLADCAVGILRIPLRRSPSRTRTQSGVGCLPAAIVATQRSQTVVLDRPLSLTAPVLHLWTFRCAHDRRFL